MTRARSDLTNYARRAKVAADDAWEIVTNAHNARSGLIRQYSFDATRALTPTIEGQSAGMRFLVRTKDKYIGRGMFNGGFEFEEMCRAIELVADAVGSGFLDGRTFVDVGANIGNSSVPACLMWGAARAVSVEPEPENFRLLRCNAVLNDVDDRILEVNAAVTTVPGTVTLELSPNNFGDHRVRTTDAPGSWNEDERSTVEVPGVRLDDLLREHDIPLESVGLLWLDTQGHEGHVLASAPHLLATKVPVITEFWPYGLRRSGGIDAFIDITASAFEMVVDVRSGEHIPAHEMKVLFERYGYEASGYTDLVLLPGD